MKYADFLVDKTIKIGHIFAEFLHIGLKKGHSSYLCVGIASLLFFYVTRNHPHNRLSYIYILHISQVFFIIYLFCSEFNNKIRSQEINFFLSLF